MQLDELITYAAEIAREIGYIRGSVHAPIVIPELTAQVGMSASSFHKHFEAITSTTPLQYQKELRLLEARRLLRSGAASVAAAASRSATRARASSAASTRASSERPTSQHVANDELIAAGLPA